MDERKPKPPRPVVIRPDGSLWHWDESEEAREVIYRSALERARLWNLRFIAPQRRRGK